MEHHIHLKDGRGRRWRATCLMEPGGLLAKPQPYDGRCLTVRQALDEVREAGIPLVNASEVWGTLEDHGLPEFAGCGHGACVDVAGLGFCDGWQEQHGWRRFVEVETDAGLAVDDAGRITSYRKGRRKLEAMGWHYFGSGTVRIEVTA